MKRSLTLSLLFLALFLLTGGAFAQSSPIWYTVGLEGQTITLPVGAIVRYGNVLHGRWSYTVTITPNNQAFSILNSSFPADPDYGFLKVLQVQLAVPTVATAVIDPNACTANLANDGTLTISLPKAAK